MKASPELAALLEPLAELVAHHVAAKLGKGGGGDVWVDARTSGLGIRTFRRAAKSGAFAVSLVGKRWVARRSDVDAWIASQRVDFTDKRDAADPFEVALAAGRLRVVGGKSR